ncbi:MAG: BREX system ATP-binding domain-containing protein [Reyranellaceae bacterium]
MDIAAWLARLGLAQYAPAFAANDIDAQTLRELTGEDLRELGVASLGHRKLLLRAIAELGQDKPGQDKPGQDKPGLVAPAGQQHREVTVLFADLCDFTGLTASMDAEDLHRLVERFYVLADAAILEAGGSVDKHLGDGIMALFGAPIAHGDDALRALRAAEALHALAPVLAREAGREIGLHIGVATGEAIVGGVGGAQHRQYTALGDVVNFAARLVAQAGPGETVVSDQLRQAVPDTVELADLGRREIKGIAAPQQVWRLAALPAQRATAQRPLVGRRAELELLAASLQSVRQGGGRIVLLRGEPGIGKTRLVEEARAQALAAGFVAHAAQVSDFGGRAGDALRQLLRQLTRGGETVGDLPPLLAAALQAGLEQPVQGDALTAWQGADETARAAAEREVLRLIAERAARHMPVLLVVEDLHWADAATLAGIGALAAATAGSLLLLLTTRGEGDPLERGLREHLAGLPFALLDLTPLRAQDAQDMAAQLSRLDPGVVASSIERSGGNPLFLEQLLRNAAEGGAENLPGSLRSLVLARFDRLPAEDQNVLHAASVLGQRFDAAALAHLVGQADCRPRAALRAGLLRAEGPHYVFAHALIREGIYRSLLRARRSELHVRAAEWHAGRDPLLRAEHLERAGSGQAAQAFLEAAIAERAAYRARAAVELADRGLALNPDAALRAALLLLRAEALLESGQARAAQDAFVLALATIEEEDQRCNALIGLAGARRIIEDLPGALEALDRAQAIAEAGGNAEARSRIHNLRGNVFFPMGRGRECLAEQHLALQWAERCGSTEAIARALGGLGDSEYAQGRLGHAGRAFRRCVAVAREAGLGRIEVANAPMMAICGLYDLDIEAMLGAANEAIALARRVGLIRPEMIALHALIQASIESGRFAAVPAAVERAQAIVHELGALRFEPENLIFLADMQERAGELAAARESCGRALTSLRASGTPAFVGPLTLAIAARLGEGEAGQRAALAEAESLLAGNALAHNHFYVRREGIDLGWTWRDAAAIRHHAAALAEHVGDDHGPWTVFVLQRAEALTQALEGQRDDPWRQRLAALRRMADERQLLVFDRALAEAEALA